MMMFQSMDYSRNITTVTDNCSIDYVNTSTLKTFESNMNILEESSSGSKPYAVSHLLHIVIDPFLIVFGTYGNALSFYIMRRGSLKKVSTCFYMSMLAIFDTCEYIIHYIIRREELEGLYCLIKSHMHDQSRF